MCAYTSPIGEEGPGEGAAAWRGGTFTPTLLRTREREQGAERVERVHTMVNAPALMVTVGPVITMDAPLPFWM